jgi:hypothetical protein
VTPRQILALLEDHPLPWRSEPAQQSDGWQVTDGRGLVVALCSSAEVAELVVHASGQSEVVAELRRRGAGGGSPIIRAAYREAADLVERGGS